ncbi:Baculoviral IAP repeat-containing protein 1b [Apodemus speciosus]|uniref:Baculoviral IAP repeat-containing protein 1b n=1 Tax=Apodemus speciosus TaxID=105296 RepID=A0ABQ0FGX3_APOSI
MKKMAAQGEAFEEKICEFDDDLVSEFSALLRVDALLVLKRQQEEDHKTRMKMKKGFNSQMRSEAKRLKTFVTYDTFRSWTPQEMAAAGFYYTGVKHGIQCFCCSLILFSTRLRKLPIENHRKLRPECEFLLGKDVGNIGKYDIRVKSPEKMLGVDKSRYHEEEARLESFEDWPFYAHGTSPRVLSAAGFVFTVCEFLQSKKSPEEIAQYVKNYEGFLHVTAYCNDSVFANEELRMDTFKDWPHNSPVAVEALVKAGLFYTGKKDIVRCFSCGGCMEKWEEGDDAMEDHTKFFPNSMETTSESNHEDPAAVHPAVVDVAPSEAQELEPASSFVSGAYLPSTDLAQSEAQWFQEARSLSEQLRDTYTKATFRHMNLPEVCSSRGTDHLLGCDVSIISKHISRPVQGALTVPETTFLKRIAFLWASGCCPLLNRFQLVFYLSLSSITPDQGLASIICAQLLEAGGCISEVCLSSSIRHLQHQVLFLLDDYSGVRDIRPYLDTILEIKEFPFYNTVSGIHKTPLFVAAVCTDWLQNPPDQDNFQDVTLFKSYMQYLSLKHKATAEPLQTTVSSCGQLALTGLFSSCFEFSSDDLAEAGVDEEEELTTCLMSKFTAQRLRPVYRFLSPLFQEFLAAMRLTELLGSDKQEDQDLGLYYLRQINSPLKVMSIYHTFFKYVSSQSSSKAGPTIVSHLLHLVDEKESLENMSENEDYMKLHPEALLWIQCLRRLWQLSPESFSLLISENLLSIALNFAYGSNAVAACSPVILQFLRGRTLNLNVLNLQYFGDHPETLLLLKSIKFSLNRNKWVQGIDFSLMEKSFEKVQPPTIDQDYAFAFQPLNELQKNLAEKEDIIKNYEDMKHQTPLNISTGYWKLSPKAYKIPRLEVEVVNLGPADQALLQVLMEVFSASHSIEFCLFNSSGFLESIYPALELNKTSVTKCSMSRVELSTAEQELLLTLPALQSLEVSGTNQIPDQLFPNLDKFLGLKELSVRLDGKPDVLSFLPGEFPNLHHMEKLSIRTSTESDLSKLVKLIQNSPNLHVFNLKCDFLSNCESLMSVLASCKKLREIEFTGRCFEAMPFVNILPNFVSLKILNLKGQQFPDKETSEKFAQALGSLRNLEELRLPTGDGIHQVAKLIIRQCLQLPCLRVLIFAETLDDASVLEIAKGAASGSFQRLENLDLRLNHKITEEGYRNFFQVLDNLPNLQDLDVSRHIPEHITVQATTVKALGQCMSRLPSLTRLGMLSWLLDEEDMKVINDVKERHPQSKHLIVHWRWVVPFSPVIQN